VCAHFRERISLRADGELSEFERAALNAHLAGCADCRAYSISVANVTTQLRSAPLEHLAFSIVLPNRSFLHVPVRAGYVAAVALVVAVGFTAAGATRSGADAQVVAPRPHLSAARIARATLDVRVTRTAPRPVRAGAEIV
jgi:hypothetical protein